MLNNSCLSTCPKTTLADTGSQSCQICTAACQTCANQLNNCTSCISGTFLLNNTCANSCPNGSAAVAASSQCEKCQTGCTTRNHSIQNCTGCSSGFFYNFSCLQDLPNRILSQRFNQPLHAPITAQLAVMQQLISSAALFSPTFPVSVSQLAPPLCPIT